MTDGYMKGITVYIFIILTEAVMVNETEVRERMLYIPFVYHRFNLENNDSAVNIEVSCQYPCVEIV